MTATEKMFDLQTVNAHLIEQYKNLVISNMTLFFRSMVKKINKEIKGSYSEDMSFADKTKLKKKLNEIQEIELNKIHTQTMRDSYKLLGSQAITYENQLKEVLGSVSEYIKVNSVDEKTLKNKYDKTPILMEKGGYSKLNTLWATFFLSVKDNLNQNTENAYSLKKTTREYTSDLNRGYKINENSLNGVIAVMLQQAYSIAIRTNNDVNDEFVKGYIWDSIIDSRTSDFCLTHNQKYWIYDHPELSTLEAEIYAPYHYRCRSTNPPIIKSYRELGIPANELTSFQKELLQNSKPTESTYAQFFDRQPDSIKKDLLGAVRYNSYQQGTPVTKFFTKDGRRLTLKQLQSKNVEISKQYLKYVN